MKNRNFEIIAAAQDTGGEEAAGKWYDRAKATYTTLIDVQHTVSSLYDMVNVPTGVWIDEQGRVVRPSETAYTTNAKLTFGGKSISTEGEVYVAALRDWVANGDKSVYALNDEEFRKRVEPRSPALAEADASFKMAVYFHAAGNPELAEKYWEHAQELNPDDWNYHRQDWSFTPQEAGKKWMEKFQKTNKPYYAPLDMPKNNGKTN